MKLTKTTFFLGCLVGGMGASVIPLLLTSTQAQTKLLPFQGRLTDAAGTSIDDGAKVVEFKMYDAPTGGTVKWAGEVHKLSVNGGLVNTMLGSKSSLGSVDFSTPCYLQITVDANDSKDITAADPPLLPRQSVVGAVYASVAGGLQYTTTASNFASVSGKDLFDTAGKVKAEAIAENNALTAAHLGSDAVNTDELKNGSVTAAKLGGDVAAALLVPNSVTASQLADNSVDSAAVIDGEIKSSDLAVSSVTAAKIGDGEVPSAKLNLARAMFREQKGANENGGSGIAGGWSRRVLNYEENQSGGNIVLQADGSFTLGRGTYLVTAVSTAGTVNSHQCAIRAVEDPPGTMTLLGTTQHASGRYWDAYGATISSHATGFITVSTSTKRYELVHFIGSQMTNFGFTNFSLGTHNNQNIAAGTNPQPSVYAQISLLKIQ